MSKNVVVVESPAKAKTIGKYLGNDYVVLASYGHIRDLPAKNGSVDPKNDFSMLWEIGERSHKHIDEISKAVKSADTLLLATDPDREGEAISWHVQEVLRDKNLLNNKKVERIVFHEITKTAIQKAIKEPRPINMELVEAYLARRALDYLVGFTLSPVLWRKLPGARSAGRVQSVALRLIVDREQSIESFKNQEYWTITADLLSARQDLFTARLTQFNTKKLDKFAIPNEQTAHEIADRIRQQDFAISSIDKKQVKRHPSAPFITSTLQQEAARKLGFSASRTMQLAQKLYEGVAMDGEVTGLISYMRTDSVTLSQDAVQEGRQFLKDTYGDQYVPESIRQFKTKAKNAQEAHEAIRPTLLSRRPSDVARFLDDTSLKLYDLIWKRTLASLMESALFDQVAVDIASTDASTVLRATGSTLVFDGFLKLYQEGVDEAPDLDIKDAENVEGLLPPLNDHEAVTKESVSPHQHFTQPPPRFTEASLVKKLEELGIGRPSTYASLLQVLQDRDYVKLEKRQFIPEDRGRLVTSFLTNFFKQYVEYDFTANLEGQLDEISAGTLPWQKVLELFWEGFNATVEATGPLRITEVIERLEEDLDHYLFKDLPKEERICPTCNKGQLSLKLSRFGAFLGCSCYPDCKYTRPVGQTSESAIPDREPVLLGEDPNTQEIITLRTGPYGEYLQWDLPVVEGAAIKEELPPTEEEAPAKKKRKKKVVKPKRVSIPKELSAAAITLDVALKLKELPKAIGVNSETALPVLVGIGRFGPYVKHGEQFISIPKGDDDVLNLSLDRACEIITAKLNKPVRTKTTKALVKKKVVRSKAKKA
ncbi:MAG: type I DNA topoisomerase [Alphaproteobacteria bacterium]|nr:type I DNA topoisomerase [Alphaproteobacteria bacterium]